ncbi:MAM domain-containing protein 2 [Protopterus annectens]|uniref:MAM domain-containing protein 2 n=1 Tax=Protopterus annectens TaxID=7888 RepID=UPI001CFA403B|nr:MAM domain-containing protein 2 [Protopterus annectens]
MSPIVKVLLVLQLYVTFTCVANEVDFLSGTKKLPGSCDFQGGICGYESENTSSVEWILNEEGRYISLDHSFGDGPQKSVLVSPDLQPMEWTCLRVIYQISTSVPDYDPSKLNVYIRPEGESFDFLLWSGSDPSDSWLIASIDLKNTSQSYKIVLEGLLGEDTGASIAIFEISLTLGYCLACDFEENSICGYMNFWNPNVNWFVGGGAVRNSPSTLTMDHTLKNETGHYMYVDSIYAKRIQEVAQLMSPITTTPMSGCFSFHYQIQKASEIEFMLYTRDKYGHYEEIWKAEEYTPSKWNLAEVNIRAPYPIAVIFEVAFYSAVAGYVALDDISFSPHLCANETDIFFDTSEASCDFEDDICSFKQDIRDGPGWTRVTVKRNVYRPGDHTTGQGYFLLTSTKSSRFQSGYIRHLYGPTLPEDLKYCLRFFYAMYGYSKVTSTLAVYLYEENLIVREKIWSSPSTSKGIWTEAEVSFQKPMSTKIVFVSLCKSFWDCGLIGLDDITVTLGDCRNKQGLWLSHPGECTFEVDGCGYTQQKRDRSSWHRTRGSTPTSFTGPQGDHTTGVGYYMYIEASNMHMGQKARLFSQLLRGVYGLQCVTFFYHMYGSGTGILNVYLKVEGENKEQLLWRRVGDQSISWLRDQVEYKCNRNHKIIFEAIRGLSLKSDIAIDDISLQKGSCKELEITRYSSRILEDLNEIEY